MDILLQKSEFNPGGESPISPASANGCSNAVLRSTVHLTTALHGGPTPHLVCNVLQGRLDVLLAVPGGSVIVYGGKFLQLSS